MVDVIQRTAEEHDGKACVVTVDRLKDLKNDIEAFSHEQELNGFQKYIVNDMYQFNLSPVDFPIRSVIVIASKGPAYAHVSFDWQGRKIPAVSFARAYPGRAGAFTETKRYLIECLEPMGYHIEPTGTLPLKRLAVCGGLAQYGRNNITYVGGMGSFHTLAAYFTDVPCEEDNWRNVTQMDCCDGCLACLGNCPTGALREDRFLIDTERCLSFFNEFPGDFPEWLPRSAHHCLYDCLMCQNVCPANRERIEDVIGLIEFDGPETEMLLAGTPMPELPAPLQAKVKFLGMDQWYAAIPRNMLVLFEQ